MIKSRSNEPISVYFGGVSITRIYYKGIVVWPSEGSESLAEDLACFNNSAGVWNDDLPWNDEVNWID